MATGQNSGENTGRRTGSGGIHVTGRKWNPGHYAALQTPTNGDAYDTKTPIPDIISYLGEPGIQGIHYRVFWKYVQPTDGAAPANFDWSGIDTYFQLAVDAKKQFILFIAGRTFSGNIDPNPAWLSQYSLPGSDNGYVLARWHPTVTEKLNVLTAAIGERYDNSPYFQGICFNETANGVLDNTQLQNTDYSVANYRAQYDQQITDACNNLPNSRVFYYQNFWKNCTPCGDLGEGYADTQLDELCRDQRGKDGATMSGPDILINHPNATALDNRVYPRYPDNADFQPMALSCQNDSYSDSAGLQALYDKGVALGINYLFWTTTSGSVSSFDPDAINIINANPIFNWELW